MRQSYGQGVNLKRACAQGVNELNMRMGHAPGVESFLAKMQNAPVNVPTCSTRTPVLHKKFKSLSVCVCVCVCECVCVCLRVCIRMHARSAHFFRLEGVWKRCSGFQKPFEAIASTPIASVAIGSINVLSFFFVHNYYWM